MIVPGSREPKLHTDKTPQPHGRIHRGCVKCFSQRSGWGFIQVFDNDTSELNTSREVFFHRADIFKSGVSQIRPGTMVQCGVIMTQTGEKATSVRLLPDSVSPGSSRKCSVSEESVDHPSVSTELSGEFPGSSIPWPNPLESPSFESCASQALEGWFCMCGHYNSPHLRSCADCNLPYMDELMRDLRMHPQAQQMAPSLGPNYGRPKPNGTTQTNKERSQLVDGGMQVGFGDLPGSDGGLGVYLANIRDKPLQYITKKDVAPAAGPSALGPGETPGLALAAPGGQSQGPGPRDEQRIVFASLRNPPPEAADPAPPEDEPQEQNTVSLFSKSEPRLLWARDWLLKGAPCNPEDSVLTLPWLYRFSEEICSPRHRLLCPMGEFPALALVPEACTDLADSRVLLMYEAIGRVMALALAHRIPLHPALPVWMARAVLEYPLTFHDLHEFSPQLFLRVESVLKHPNPEAFGLTFSEVIQRHGIVRRFEGPDGPVPVTLLNREQYATWLKGVYLNDSLETQLKYIRQGFFFTLQGDARLQGLSPPELSAVLTGECALEVGAITSSIQVCRSLRRYVPHLEQWFWEVTSSLSAHQWLQLLRFSTGYCKAPFEGLQALDQCITIRFNPALPPNGLPVALGLGNEVFLGQYSSPSVLRQMLVKALESQSVGFRRFPH